MILHGYLCFVEVAMKFTRALIGLFALLLSGAAITLVSQEKSSPTHVNYTYTPTSEQTMRGWVVETRDFQCPVTGTVGSHITVKNETGSIEVHLAPASFMKQYEINIRKGDNVTVVGSKIMFEGKGALIAKSVAIGNETYNFRDQSGRPLW
jgi:DNA/RNA endonuclease YhcR with UshA esterase domain